MIEREYRCDKCDAEFMVIHSNDIIRNTHCHWCGNIVKETGKTETIEDGFVVEQMNNVEISRREINKL
jgi:DNA-directed RNA polymerase subunit RPC12/RpoP